MILTIHQPEHLPWLGYFHKMALADCYVFLDCVQFRYRYFQNRNQVQGAAGPTWVTVPVQKLQHRYGPIAEILIDNSRDWRKSYCETIKHHYRQHPYYRQYADELVSIIMAPHKILAEFNYALIDFFRRSFGMTTPLAKASQLDVSGTKTAIIQAICQRVGAKVYISGPSGRDYLDELLLRRNGIEVWYHKFQHPTYHQHKRTEFTPQLSALDLLMNCGPASREVLGLTAIDRELQQYRAATAVA